MAHRVHSRAVEGGVPAAPASLPAPVLSTGVGGGNGVGDNSNSSGRNIVSESAREIAFARRRAAQKELDEYVANGVIIDMIHIANIDVPFQTMADEGNDEWAL